MLVDAAHEWGFTRYSEFEQLSDEDKAVAVVYTRTVKLMRSIEVKEQIKQAHKPARKGKH